jgi:hypothetical protein
MVGLVCWSVVLFLIHALLFIGVGGRDLCRCRAYWRRPYTGAWRVVLFSIHEYCWCD